MEISAPAIISYCARQERERMFTDLYKQAFPPFVRFASTMNVPFQDAKDIFHDALVIFFEKSSDSYPVIQTSPEAYILGIAKHLWLRKFKQDRNKISLDVMESGITLPENYFPTVNENQLLKILERSGRKCLELLRAFYYDRVNLKEIAAQMGYRNEHSATVQKYKCIEKVRDTVKANSISYEDFID
jgi:DNA-directed RNA polymerase specialized sigma24 family protein